MLVMARFLAHLFDKSPEADIVPKTVARKRYMIIDRDRFMTGIHTREITVVLNLDIGKINPLSEAGIRKPRIAFESGSIEESVSFKGGRSEHGQPVKNGISKCTDPMEYAPVKTGQFFELGIAEPCLADKLRRIEENIFLKNHV